MGEHRPKEGEAPAWWQKMMTMDCIDGKHRDCRSDAPACACACHVRHEGESLDAVVEWLRRRVAYLEGAREARLGRLTAQEDATTGHAESLEKLSRRLDAVVDMRIGSLETTVGKTCVSVRDLAERVKALEHPPVWPFTQQTKVAGSPKSPPTPVGEEREAAWKFVESSAVIPKIWNWPPEVASYIVRIAQGLRDGKHRA